MYLAWFLYSYLLSNKKVIFGELQLFMSMWQGGRCSNVEIEKSMCSRLKVQQKKLSPCPTQNLIIKLKKLGYLNFYTTTPKWWQVNHSPHSMLATYIH